MSISSALNAGVMGLNSNSSRLSTISDNIANSSTYGYKRSQVDFSSMVLDQQSSAYAAGGVRVNAFKDISATGSLISTGNATDMAVSGRGLLPVTDGTGVGSLASERSLMLTPTGSFYADQNGNLRTQSGLFLLGWPATTDGEIGNVSRNSGINLEPVNISASQYTASPTESIDLGINLPVDATEAGAPGDSYPLPIEYFDNLGRAQTLTLEFTPSVPGSGYSNEWTVQAFDSAGNPAASIGDLDITFDDSPANGGRIQSVNATNGASYDSSNGRVTLNMPHGPIEIYIGRPNDSSGITQLSAPFSPTAVTKNGAPIGDLQSVEIDDDGYLKAIYNTGFRRTLYQIPVGDVPNMNGLKSLDSQAYSVSAESGNLYLWDAGSGPVGTVSGYSLMESTTDIASELTDLIETQRAYSSNAKIVQTVDEMLQETTNLKR
ncbi:flagellar hook protein FlgE [Henriciella aquimarina]|uniref:flagellar hook protein FlgE n=1 Tax=Henriciella aquimarina TaxID=545261 RepID=UPI000A028521|nr:flagellar hook-basal body complex protein [Henriciella aquimarina]